MTTLDRTRLNDGFIQLSIFFMYSLIRIRRGELDRAFNRAYRACLNGIRIEERSLMGPIRGTLFQRDLAFFVMLFSNVYKFQNNSTKNNALINKATIYAANMDVIVSYSVFRRKSPARTRLFPKKAYRLVNLYYPGKVQAIETLIDEFEDEIENLSRDPDQLAGIIGKIFAEIFAWREDKYTGDFKTFAYYLGKHYYLKKLYEELKNDEKKGYYNPLIFVKKNDPESFETYIKQILKSHSTACMEAFRRIPIRENETILNHALNAGIWTKTTQI